MFRRKATSPRKRGAKIAMVVLLVGAAAYTLFFATANPVGAAESVAAWNLAVTERAGDPGEPNRYEEFLAISERVKALDAEIAGAPDEHLPLDLLGEPARDSVSFPSTDSTGVWSKAERRVATYLADALVDRLEADGVLSDLRALLDDVPRLAPDLTVETDWLYSVQLDHLGEFRTAAAVLTRAAIRGLEGGRPGDAVDDLRRIAVLRQLVHRDPTLVSSLTDIVVIRGLCNAIAMLDPDDISITDADFTAATEVLLELDARASVIDGIGGERGFLANMLDLTYTRSGLFLPGHFRDLMLSISEIDADTTLVTRVMNLTSPLYPKRASVEADYDNHMSRLREAAAIEEPDERFDRLRAIKQDFTAKHADGTVLGTLMPALYSTINGAVETEHARNRAVCNLAHARFKTINGRAPESIAELVRVGLLDPAPAVNQVKGGPMTLADITVADSNVR